MDGKDLPFVLLPRLDWELIEADIEKLDGTVASSDYALVLVCFGPGEVVEGILGIKPLARTFW